MSDLIPFGKYRGQEITQVIQRDPAYIQWLTQQAWFSEKFSPIYQLVINNFAPASDETPAHNALQVQFLDFDFRVAVLQAVKFDDYVGWEFCKREFRSRFFSVPVLGKWSRSSPASVEAHRAKVRELWSRWRLRHNVSETRNVGDPRFEEISDVTFTVDLRLRLNKLELRCGDHIVMVEIKPSMGDDYPAVLRQMKRQRAGRSSTNVLWILLVDSFASQSVTLAQVREVFARDSIRIVMMAEVRDCLALRRAETT